jgi:hypothetical protein
MIGAFSLATRKIKNGQAPMMGRRSDLICAEDWLCSALHGGIRRRQTDAGQRPRSTTEERERIKALERESRELRKAGVHGI